MATMPQPAAPQPPPVPSAVAAAVTAPAVSGDGAVEGQSLENDPLPPKLSFFQQPWVQNVLPFATSLVLHLSLIVVGLTLFKVVPRVVQAVKEQMIVPDSNIVNDAPVGGVTNPGLSGDPNRAAAQDKVETADSSSFSDKKTESLSQSLMGGSPNDAADNVIGLGKNTGVVSGVGKANGPGSGDGGGALAPFGVPGGGSGSGPKMQFAGISGNAHRIVYLVDASGSMMTVFPHVKEELYKSVDKLQVTQQFNVIFFHEDDSELSAFTKGELAMATPNNKLAVHKFAGDQSPHGGTQPINAIKLAFNQHPELIYVLTDGFDNVESFQDVIDTFKKLNIGNKTKVNTILLKSREDPQLIKILQSIADQSGGRFVPIDEKDF